MNPLHAASILRSITNRLGGKLATCWSSLRGHWGACWSFARALSTDDAYEHYLEHHCCAPHDRPALSRREFYLLQQKQKWSGVQRCC